MGGGGREGDWECSGCGNRNYAFRCFCNRCKQPRLLVDGKTPLDSKWLPRIGDWICNGCTNNNYASREKCKKCGQPKEVAAMPAAGIPGASLPTYPNYFARAPSGFEQRIGLFGSGAPPQSLSLSSNWSLGGANNYGFQSSSTWPAGGIHSTNVAHAAPANPLMTTTNGWRSGDWICACGFHNYSSRAQCKKCNSAPPAAPPIFSPPATGLGTKRLASDELAHGWDSKRLNAGQTYAMPPAYSGAETMGFPNFNQSSDKYASTYLSGSSSLTPNLQVNFQTPTMPAPALFGKGAKQWRDGDWMCVKCDNHNYASRSQCNRCKTEREVLSRPVTVS